MAWIAPIGSAPEQIDYRLGLQHGCTAGAVDDAQFAYRTEQERPLIWIGNALADLGIQAGTELTADKFDQARALVNGRHPITGEQLVKHKVGVPREAKVQLAPLVYAIEGVAKEANVDVAEVLRHREGRWAGHTSKRMLDMYKRARRAVDDRGEIATLRADHAGLLADAAGVPIDQIWDPDTFAAAVSNLTKTITVVGPDGTRTEQVVDNRRVVGNLAYGYDLGVPKSVSELLNWSDKEFATDLAAILTEAATKTFHWVEANTAYGMRGHHGDGSTAETTPGNGFAGWMMIHRTARPTEGELIGDPHWHVHITFANMTKGQDDEWSTVAAGGRDLMRHAPASDQLMQAYVRHVLTERYGIAWRRSERTNNWEIAAIPDAAILEFSRRGTDIQAMLHALGFTEQTASAGLKRIVQQETRLAKTEAVLLPDDRLREHFQQRAREAGHDPEALTRAARSGAGPGENHQPTIAELARTLQDADKGLTSRTRRFSRLDALYAVAAALPTGGTHDDIESLTDQVLAHAGFVQLRTGVGAATTGERKQLGASHMQNAKLYTTQDIIEAEKIIVAAARASDDDQTDIRVPRITAEMAASTLEASNGWPLSDEQHRELLELVTAGRAIDALVGAPGSGKTTLMDAVRVAYQAEGFVVAGAATQGVAAQNLQAESGIPSRTVAQWLYRVDNGDGLRGVDVLVLDESGMTDDRDRARLYLAAQESGTKIIEIFDPKQLRGVGCGSMAAVVHQLVEGGQLLDNRRQVDEDERAALAAWREGNYSEALTSWADRDRLIVGETAQDAMAAMLATWMDQRLGAPDPMTEMRGLLMVASTNEQVERLNAGAQAIRDVQGELGVGRTYTLAGGKTLRLHVNDHVMVRINSREKGKTEALNGYRGIVTDIHPDGRIGVTWVRNTADGLLTESRTFEPAFVADGGLTHGYALTSHKSQGLNVKETWKGGDGQLHGGAVLFYAAGADNPAAYVSASRHTQSMWMFAARQDVETPQDVYLLGMPDSTFTRRHRVVTKLAERFKATEDNANDRPVLADLGRLPELADASKQPASDRGLDHRVNRKAEETARRVAAAELLRQEWDEHEAVQAVVDGRAFGTVARWVERMQAAGADPGEGLRRVNPDDLLRPGVRDPSRIVAAVLKRAANGADTADADARPAREAALREHAAEMLREAWNAHPNVDVVTAGSAFGALAQNLANAGKQGHDPQQLLRAIKPSEIEGKENPAAFIAWRVRTSAADLAAAEADRATPPAVPAASRLDVLVPTYQQTVSRLAPAPDRTPGGDTASAKRDGMWPSWLPPAPVIGAREGRDRALAAASAADAQRIRARVIALVTAATRERPDWVEQLGGTPEGPAQRSRYIAAVATIAAYREQHGVTGPDPVGPVPTDPNAQLAYQAALRALELAVRASTPQPVMPASQPAHEQPAHPGPAHEQQAIAARQRAEQLLEQKRRVAHHQRDLDHVQRTPGRGGPRPGV